MSSTEEMLRKAVAAYQSGHLAEAEAGYKAVLRQQPRSHLALYGLALLSYYAGATEQAIDYVRRSLAFEPNVGLTWNWFGTLCIQTDRLAEGKAAFKRATELSPLSGEAWSNLAHCLIREQNLDAAADLLRRSLTCPQPPSRAFESLTNILCQQGQVPEAARTAAAWLAREPANPIARHMAASVSGQNPPSRASDEYVRAHFDAFAEAGFDAAMPHSTRSTTGARNSWPHTCELPQIAIPHRHSRSSLMRAAAPACADRSCALCAAASSAWTSLKRCSTSRSSAAATTNW